MSIQPSIGHIPPILPAASGQAAVQAAQALGRLLCDTPECQVHLKALQEVNHDAVVKRLLSEIREHETALKFGNGNHLEHQSALTALEVQFEALPSVQAYRLAEKRAAQLFFAVNEVISREAGVDFAANAKRSGCGCGG